ncbi:hypothetical protein BC936DRAFT_148683 [Jimgerdemannia flammicorona]|uniref:Uncharacterized protein n=1 Tax=Jimgerdemannia flammicorona TaxID=994334 RepID=A0A433D2H7_9FUNG|nr:hypothetical protein BC936DRAFT_148683 [Jimgerdemannia flammicorona]
MLQFACRDQKNADSQLNYGTNKCMRMGNHDHYIAFGGGVEAGEGAPVVDNEASADHVGAAVDGSSDKRDLEERRKLVLVLDRGARMHKPALIADRAEGADEDVIGDSLAKNFNLEDISNNFFRFLL